MKGTPGVIFSAVADNPSVPGCTISQEIVHNVIYHFSLAAHTDISPECYAHPKVWLILSGSGFAFGGVTETRLTPGDIYRTPVEVPIGVRTDEGLIYTEISVQEDTNMNESIKSGAVFALKDLVPYQEGRIVNRDVINEPKLKLVLMSFAPGTGLSEHAAPGEALIFALDGEAVIRYEGVEHTIHAGENFKFDKLGKHAIEAKGNFRMALLLTLE